MRYFDWSSEKNQWLAQKRGVSFERVLVAIESGYLLDIIEHPAKVKYPDQRIFIVEIEDYAYLVPFVEDQEKIFLKTIIPSRKATKKYLNKKQA
jgi:uncharacterized DUF497 family protein